MPFDRCNLDLRKKSMAEQSARVERLRNTTRDEALDIVHLKKIFHCSVEEIDLILEERVQRWPVVGYYFGLGVLRCQCIHSRG